MGPKSAAKPPRTDKYLKLLHRFYEPLILLRVLGQTRGPHISSPQDASPTQAARRRLLRNLSYLCDYEKGGTTTSAIGLEETDQCFIFWIASNEARTRQKIVAFLRNMLREIRRINQSENDQNDHSKTEFIHTCIGFARSRVKKEIKLLSRSMKECEQHLDKDKIEIDSRLATWLSKFTLDNSRSVEDVCVQAYDGRKSPEMRLLENHIHTTSGDSCLDRRAHAFAKVRHCLGRLADHVRAPMKVIEDSAALHHLFSEYKVRLVNPAASNQRPQADSHTDLRSILNRMLPARESEFAAYEQSLVTLDRKFQITARVRETYEKFEPGIHAEVQVLEHFHAARLRFVDNDNYIGCSKPACYCCHLYFQHHPSHPVVPESHQKVYLNWGVPLLPGGPNDGGYIAQRDLLNTMVKTIRENALNQIKSKDGPLKWHADSLTGITDLTVATSFSTRDVRGSILERQSTASDTDAAILDDSSSITSWSDIPPESSRSPREDSADSSRGVHDGVETEVDSDSDPEGGATL
ncbi:hypothetical protein F4677DRAFT_36696 [Hypoxylon crocopeplum]|nr:hypothetical protein F4677DRAFT_36696 [Hypoxylon crocopeplum]